MIFPWVFPSQGTLVRCHLMMTIQGGPKKVSHYRELSSNRIKNRQPG